MPGKKRLAALVLASLACAVVLSGCCSIGLKTCAINDDLVFVGDRDLNNCNNTSSIPVTVRIYYLKQKDTFLKSSFDELWRDPEGTLGSDIIGTKRSTTVTPGGEIVISEVRPPEAMHVGIIADFCQDDGAWHKVLDLTNKELKKIVTLKQVHLKISE